MTKGNQGDQSADQSTAEGDSEPDVAADQRADQPAGDPRTDQPNDQPRVDAAREAVTGVSMSTEQRNEFVVANRFSPEREAVQRAYRESFSADVNQTLDRPRLAGPEVNMPVGEDQVPAGFDVESMTVSELEAFADDHPQLVGAILEAEQARDHVRKGVVEAMERRQAADAGADAQDAEGTAEGV